MCLEYLRRLFGDRFEWIASQEIGDRFPQVERPALDRSVILVAADGRIFHGADAIFRAIALSPERAGFEWLYRWFPPFRWITDWLYSSVASHRNAAHWLARAFIGPELRPLSYGLTESVFLRALGIIYFFAFASLQGQLLGLIGSHGINPVAQVMQAMRNELSWRAVLLVPSIFWFNVSDGWLVWACALGATSACVLFAAGWLGVFWQRLSAVLCFGLYLSLASIGQPFTLFQWDALLIEAGFLAIFAGTPFLVWPYRFLLFRLMFESGAVKLLSGDPNWRNLRALRFHFVTQPLPNPPAWYAYQAPGWLLDSLTFGTLAIELLCPFLLFFPRRIRHIGASLLIALQICILLTGNYAFFNLLAIALCFWAFDDFSFSRLSRVLKGTVLKVERTVLRTGATVLVVALMAIGAVEVVSMFAPNVTRPLNRLLSLVAPWQIVNSYGLFAVMTTTRPELIFEGSNDNQTWKEYSFKYKPGDVKRPLPVVAPHQPRLDWQLWFAALGGYREDLWVGNFVIRLLQADPAVLSLLERPPFEKGPKYIRVSVYDYWFTTPDERKRTGAIWNRRLEGPYLPSISLDMLKSAH
jgi:hypothetical protein